MEKIFSTRSLLVIFCGLLIGLCSISCFGQENPQIMRSRWSYGLRFSGGLSDRTLKGSSNLVSLRNAKEKAKPGFEAGIQLNYKLSDRFDINSGLILSDFGYKTPEEQLNFSDQTTAGFRTNIDYTYISVPLNIRYTFLKIGKIGLFVGTGVSPSIFIQKNTVLKYTIGNQEDRSSNKEAVGYNRFNLTADAQLGADFKVCKALKVNTNFYFKRFISAVNPNLPDKEYLGMGGLSLGITYTPLARIKNGSR